MDWNRAIQAAIKAPALAPNIKCGIRRSPPFRRAWVLQCRRPGFKRKFRGGRQRDPVISRRRRQGWNI